MTSFFSPADPAYALVAIAALLVGLAVWVIGLGMLIVQTFRQSLWWGIGSLLFMPILYIFVGMYWRTAKKGFLLHLLGIGLLGLGLYMAGQMGVDLTPVERYII